MKIKKRSAHKKVSRASATPKQRAQKSVPYKTMDPIIQAHWDKRRSILSNYKTLGLVSNLQGKRNRLYHNPENIEIEEHSSLSTDDHVQPASDGEWCSLEEFNAMPSVTVHSVSSNYPADDHEQLPYTPYIEEELAEIDPRAKRIGAMFTDMTEAGKDAEESSSTSSKDKPLHTAVAQLIEKANAPVIKQKRHPATNEQLALVELIAKHGMDYEAMARDIKLNVYQMTTGELKRKVKRLIEHYEIEVPSHNS